MHEYRRTYRTLEKALESIEESAGVSSTLSGILEAIVLGPGPELGITGARLYQRDRVAGAFVLSASAGESGGVEPGFSVSESYPPIERLLKESFILMEQDDPEFDRDIEGALGVLRFAAITVGDHAPYIIAFTVTPELDPERAILLLGTIRHVINLKMTQRNMLEDIEEARRIQLSLLPMQPPKFHGYDFAFRTLPAEEVGGDLFDFIEVSDRALGVAIGDSTGHGLPAALMARDVVTGLRVAIDIDYRLTRGIERVNRVVARSALSSRFISLLYVEFETTGNVVYCNAGHPPGLICRGGRIARLRHGGPVLGPIPSATYERGYQHFPPGSSLLLFTDGITEAQSPKGKEFGEGRLERIFRETQHLSAQGIVDRIFEEVATHAPGARQDDQTLVVVKRPN